MKFSIEVPDEDIEELKKKRRAAKDTALGSSTQIEAYTTKRNILFGVWRQMDKQLDQV